MRVEPLLISWHHKKYPEPVFSSDFHRSGRLATAGGDETVKLWRPHFDTSTGRHQVEFLASLSRHLRGVNCVRFAPSDPLRLASASDDGVIFVWEPSKAGVDPDRDELEAWSATKMMKAHSEDIYDLAWSPDGQFLVSGSIDNSSIVWDVAKGQVLQRLHEHSHYVQGVSWDPLSTYLLTQSSDRSARFYKRVLRHKKLSFRSLGQLKKRVAPAPPSQEEGAPNPLSHNYFRDETISTFFRRMDWSPDGMIAVLPTGQYREAEGQPFVNACYIFSRFDLESPAFLLPFPGQKAVLAVRFSPRLYRHRSSSSSSSSSSALLGGFPYRMIFAVATLNGVFIMDTSCDQPVAHADQLHYATLTDLSWTSDGRTLCISSKDGYCSFLSFDEGELGEEIPEDEQEDIMRELRQKEALWNLSPKEREKALRRLVASGQVSSQDQQQNEQEEEGEGKEEEEAQEEEEEEKEAEKAGQAKVSGLSPDRKNKRLASEVELAEGEGEEQQRAPHVAQPERKRIKPSVLVKF